MKVSIITPTYNCEKFVHNTIKSVLEQTFLDFELIIIDDHSTDQTISEINRFSDKRIKVYLNDKNMGAAFCRNLGILKSKGEYIAFLDGDDIWKNNKLEVMLNFMEKNKYQFAYSSYIENVNGKNKYIIKGPEVLTHNKFKKMCYPGCLTVMFKKNLYPNLEIPTNIYKRNDYALWLKLSERSNCYFCNEILAIYVKHNSSISSSSKTTIFKSHIIMFRKLYNYTFIKAFCFALRNTFYSFFKKIIYRRKIKNV